MSRRFRNNLLCILLLSIVICLLSASGVASAAKQLRGQVEREDGAALTTENEEAAAAAAAAPAALAIPLNNETSVLESARELQTILDVVIIGAGWAGIAAARTLKSNGVNSFQVLEARPDIGGRCQTVSIGELGCQWIHGATTANPIYRLARNTKGISTIQSPFSGGYWSNVFGSSNPHRVKDSDIDSISRQHYSNGFFPFQRKKQDSTNKDQPLRNVANQYINSKNIKGNTRIGLELALDSNIVQNIAASLQDASTWWWNEEGTISGPDAIIQQGYSELLDSYAAPIKSKIKLKSVVKTIDWRNGVVNVSYQQNGKLQKVRARNAVITVPLGVLKQGSIKFTPSLPRKKRLAISKLGMGDFNKVILRWDDNTKLPWPANLNWLEKVAKLGQQGKWTEFFNAKSTTGKNVLVAFSAGREAERVEKLSNAAIRNEVMISLRSMFGQVPEPKETKITRWKRDKYSRGAYSYYKVGSSPGHRRNLRTTLGKRLYFAGEATHQNYPATTHGAFLSGQTAGKAIAKKL